MGNKPKEEPKYKLEILKMEVVPAATVTMTGKKALLVIAPKDFQETEFTKPKELLEAQGIKVTVASSTTKTAVGMSGMKVKPDVAISEVRAADYDAVVFIGGNGAVVKGKIITGRGPSASEEFGQAIINALQKD